MELAADDDGDSRSDRPEHGEPGLDPDVAGRCASTHEQVVQQGGVRTGHACHAHALGDEQGQEHPVVGERPLAEQASGYDQLADHDAGPPADAVGDDSRRQLRESADQVQQGLKERHLPGGEASLLKEEDEHTTLEQ